MTLRWGTTDTASSKSGVKMLVYGESGAGKTRLISTLPNPIIASAESGLLSLRKLKLPYAEINNVGELVEFYNWCARSHEARQFTSIAIDSLSEIGEVFLNNSKRTVKDPRQAYGEMIDRMEQVVRDFRDLPGFHVYMSAKIELMKDDMSGIVRYWPAMPGSKLGPKLPYYFDEVFQIGIATPPGGTPYRYLRTQGDMQYVAKDRSGSLDALEPPDLTHVINKILGA